MKRTIERFFVLLFCALLFTGSAEAGNFSELKDAIAKTSSGGVLVLSEDYAYEASSDSASVTEDGLVIDKPLTIEGKGFTIDALGYTRIFKVSGTSGDKVIFKDLVLTKGGASSVASGGGVFIARYMNVSFENVKITKCGTEKGVHTRDGGAAIFIDSKANVSFTNCEISDNTGNDRAGGLYLRGKVAMYDTKVTGNSSGSRGGGIYVDPGYQSPERGGEWGGNIKLYNCTISGNKGGRGGGVYVNSENEELNILENCTISSNDVSDNSKGNGGGILFYNAHAKLTNCTITDNRAKNGGGFILDVLSKLTLINCTIANNVATVGGAGLYAHDGSYVSDGMRSVGEAAFSGCIIVGNKLAGGTAQDVSIHYSDFSSDVPDWKRYDGSFVSGGYNVLGAVDLTKPEGVSDDVTITLSASDVKDAGAKDVLAYEGDAPALKDNGGKVYTVALTENSPALSVIPNGTSWLPAADARGVSRPQGLKADAGAYEKQVESSSSSGCSAASFPFILLALGGMAVFLKKK